MSGVLNFMSGVGAGLADAGKIVLSTEAHRRAEEDLLAKRGEFERMRDERQNAFIAEQNRQRLEAERGMHQETLGSNILTQTQNRQTQEAIHGLDIASREKEGEAGRQLQRDLSEANIKERAEERQANIGMNLTIHGMQIQAQKEHDLRELRHVTPVIGAEGHVLLMDKTGKSQGFLKGPDNKPFTVGKDLPASTKAIIEAKLNYVKDLSLMTRNPLIPEDERGHAMTEAKRVTDEIVALAGGSRPQGPPTMTIVDPFKPQAPAAAPTGGLFDTQTVNSEGGQPSTPGTPSAPSAIDKAAAAQRRSQLMHRAQQVLSEKEYEYWSSLSPQDQETSLNVRLNRGKK